ncbi:MAG: methionyl-tRNA formyltransferase [Proteobacteria bacterium]|nr:methionyl-tRNA formyltransferase [Pseudomonadota bacterium]
MSLNIGFFGSADFVVSFLEAIYNSNHRINFIVTSPDKPKGRGMKLTPPEPKVFAEEKKIPVFQPEKIKDDKVVSILNNFNCDIYLVIAYGKILPKELLFYPKSGSINLHFSLLPRWRGAGPVNWAIISGDKVTGLTIIEMDEGLDTGDILFQEEIIIEEDDNTITMFEKMINKGKVFLINSLNKIEKGDFIAKRQDNSMATYARMLKKEDGLIDWNESAVQINNKIRGLQPWPCAYSFLDEKRVLLLKAKVMEGKESPGLIKDFKEEGIIAGTGDGLLKILEIKEEGKKVLSAKDFYNGRKDIIGKFFKK